ncbi:MAG: lamin tail domain-containing protein, partial [Bacteroidota bacterium]
LIADQANLMAANLNGYFVRIGNTQDDICLYKNTNGTSVKIIDGLDGTTNTSNSLMKIKVTRNSSNLFTLFSDLTGTGSNFSTEGSITDNSFLTNNSFGIVVKQSTASFFQKHFFDDIYAGAIVLDQIPPVLQSAIAINQNSLDVLFNEDVDITTSQLTANYTVDNGIGNPSSATRDASNFKLVHLTFGNSFASGVTNNINISNVQDLAGNSISPNSSSNFTYYIISTPSFRDVIINEIMADPNPSAGSLPLVEWVEIYNKSNKTFNLGNWTFSDAASSATLNPKYLLPNQYLILCKNADTSSLSVFGPVCGMSSMPTLNDGGDKIYFKDNLGNFIDSVSYDASWYNDAIKAAGGWTLELINPALNNNCSETGNWIACNFPNGATPGQQNSVFSSAPDVNGPGTISVSVIDSLHLTICFNEVPDAVSSNLTSSYFINNGIGNPTNVIVSTTNNKCVDITLNSPLQNASNYLISYNGITDCSGNAANPSSFGFSFYIPKFNDIVINEIMPDPDPPISLPNYEFVELYNRTNFSIRLNDFTISTSGTTKTISDLIIQPDSFVVLTGSSGFAAYQNLNLPVFQVTSFPTLTNTGSTITIKNPQGKVIHTVSYSDSWYKDASKSEGGYSLEMVDPNNPCGGEENWRASNALSGGTPGKKNSVYASNPDLIAPILKRIAVLNADTIQLFFSENTDSLSLLSAVYTIDNSIGSSISVIPVAVNFKSVKLVLPSAIQSGIVYTCTVTSPIADCAGNLLSSANNSARFALPQQAMPGDIVINELLFDPKTGGVDFVELYNKSSRTFDLSVLKIGEQDTTSGIFNDMKTLTNEGYLLFPGEYLVLSESGSIIKSQYYTPNPNGFLDMTDLPAINTDEDVVVLTDLSNQVIDRVYYNSNFHFDLLNETKGVSLERIDFNRSSSDITNWNSAASSVGFATPAFRNSQFATGQESGELNISPQAFSPDNDGFQDVLNITYALE